MQLSIQAQSRIISLEAHAGESSIQQALTRLPSFFKDVSKTLNDAFKAPFDTVFKNKDLAWAAQVIEKYPYAALRTELFPCVPGLKTDYKTYIEALHEAAMFSSSVREDYVQPLIDFLAKKLSNPESLKSQAPDNSLVALTLAPINVLNKHLAPLIDYKHDANEMAYSKLFRRHADWVPVVQNAQVIHNAFATEDHVRFEKSAERCQELLGTLLTRLGQHPDLYKVSGKALSTISDAAYVVATAVEFYGLTYHRATVLDHSLDLLVKKVKSKN